MSATLLLPPSSFPITMVLMYTYLVGGALAGSLEEYIQFLLPGILVMSVVMLTVGMVLFLSNLFVDPRTMPGWLQAIVDNSPVIHLASAVRGLMAGDWPSAEVAWSRGWAGLFVLVFGPVTMRLYNRE